MHIKQLDNLDDDVELLEPFTPVISKGSFMTTDASECVPQSAASITHQSLGQGALPASMMQDKHLLTVVKLIETVLVLIQQDTTGKQ